MEGSNYRENIRPGKRGVKRRKRESIMCDRAQQERIISLILIYQDSYGAQINRFKIKQKISDKSESIEDLEVGHSVGWPAATNILKNTKYLPNYEILKSPPCIHPHPPHLSMLKGVTSSGKVRFWAMLRGTPTWSMRRFGSGVMTVRPEKSTRFPIRLPRIRPSLPFRRCLIDLSGRPDFCVAWKPQTEALFAMQHTLSFLSSHFMSFVHVHTGCTFFS